MTDQQVSSEKGFRFAANFLLNCENDLDFLKEISMLLLII